MQNNSRLSSLFCFSMILLYVLLILGPCLVNSGPLLQTDQPQWAAAVHIINTEIVPEQRWIWGTLNDRAGAGQEMGHLYSIGLILPTLLYNFLGLDASIKVSMILSTIVFMFGVFLVGSIFVSPGYALLGAVMALSPVFDNLVSGMWYNYLSLGLSLFFWQFCDGFFRNPYSIWRIVVCTVLLSLTFYCHPVGLFICFAIWSSYFVIAIVRATTGRQKYIVAFLVMAVCGVLMAAPQIMPLIKMTGSHSLVDVSQNTQLRMTEPFELFRRMFFIRVWGASTPGPLRTGFMVVSIVTVFCLGCYGFYNLIKKNCVNEIVPLASVILVNLFILSKAFIFFAPLVGKEFIIQLSDNYDRFQIISQVYLSILAMVTIRYLFEARKIGKPSIIRTTGLVCSLFIVACVIALLPFKVFVERTEQLGTLATSTLGNELKLFWKWANENVKPESERVYFEDSYGKLHWNKSLNPEAYKSHAFALTSIYTPISQIGGWCGYTNRFAKAHEVGGVFYLPSNSYGHEFLESISDEEIHDEMRLLNCKYLVALSPTLLRRLSRVDFMKERADFGHFKVFENARLKPAWAYGVETDNKIQFLRHSSHKFDLIAIGSIGDLIHVSMAFHPRWRATCDGKDVTIINHNELMQIRLTKDGFQRVHFEFTIERGIPLALFLSGFIGIGVFILLGLLHQRRT